MTNPCNRQTARAVIAKVLGLQSDDAAENVSTLRDDDDFYLLGGDSLLVVRTVELLESLQFKVDMSVFHQTGNIGQILDSLVLPDDNPSTKALLVKSKSIELGYESMDIPIKICEWKRTESEPTQEEIMQLVVAIFTNKNIVLRAFGFSVADVAIFAGKYFRQNCRATILLAYVPTHYMKQRTTSEEYKLVGEMLCCPSVDLKNLGQQPRKVELLNRYLDSCYASEDEAREIDSMLAKNKTLYVGMTGVLSDKSGEAAGFVGYDKARWKRMRLEVLSQMERRVIELARIKGFNTLVRFNTTEISMKISLDLGYRIVGKNNLKTFAANENIEIDPKYHMPQCYFMLKELNIQ